VLRTKHMSALIWIEAIIEYWFNYIQVCTFHDGCKQGIDQQIFNRKSISLIRIRHMSALIWIETIIEYWFNYSSSSKFSSAARTLKLEPHFCFSRRFHNAGNILRWWYILLIVVVHLLLNQEILCNLELQRVSKISQKYNPSAVFL